MHEKYCGVKCWANWSILTLINVNHAATSLSWLSSLVCLWWAGINASRSFQIQVWSFFIVKHTQSLRSPGLVYTKHQRQSCDNSAMMLEILSSLKTKESLGNGLQPHSGVTLLFSMRTVLLVLSHSHWPIPNGLNWTTPDAAVVYQPRILLHLPFDLIFPDIFEYFLA